MFVRLYVHSITRDFSNYLIGCFHMPRNQSYLQYIWWYVCFYNVYSLHIWRQASWHILKSLPVHNGDGYQWGREYSEKLFLEFTSKDFVPMSVFSETNQGENLNSCSLKNLTTCVSFCGLVNTNIFSTHGCCGHHMLHWMYLREDEGVAFNQIPRWLRIVKAVFVNCWPK